MSVILGGGGGSAVKGMYQRPFGFRLTVMMIVLFFRIFNWYLKKIAIQPSSQNCPLEINEPVLRSSNTKACCVLSDNFVDKGMFASEWGK